MSFKIMYVERKEMTSKAGKTYQQLIINDDQNRRLTGFGNKTTDTWKVGDVIGEDQAKVVQNGKYYNIEMVARPFTKKNDNKDVMKELDEINQKLDEMNSKILSILSKLGEEDIDF